MIYKLGGNIIGSGGIRLTIVGGSGKKLINLYKKEN